MTEEIEKIAGYKGNNKHIRRFIDEIAEETGIDAAAVWTAIYHFLSWQWCSFNKGEYMQYVWDRCFVFKFFNRTKNMKRFNKPEMERAVIMGRHHKPSILAEKLDYRNLMVTDEEIDTDNISLIYQILDEDPELFIGYIRELSYGSNSRPETVNRITRIKHQYPCCVYLERRLNKSTRRKWNKIVLRTLELSQLTEILELIEKAKQKQAKKNAITKAVQS